MVPFHVKSGVGVVAFAAFVACVVFAAFAASSSTKPIGKSSAKSLGTTVGPAHGCHCGGGKIRTVAKQAQFLCRWETTWTFIEPNVQMDHGQ